MIAVEVDSQRKGLGQTMRYDDLMAGHDGKWIYIRFSPGHASITHQGFLIQKE